MRCWFILNSWLKYYKVNPDQIHVGSNLVVFNKGLLKKEKKRSLCEFVYVWWIIKDYFQKDGNKETRKNLKKRRKLKWMKKKLQKNEKKKATKN